MRNTDSAIGGYFELETCRKRTEYHNDALALNSGRNALEHILRCKQYKRIHIPYFTCEALLEPIKKLSLDYIFYHIDEVFFSKLANHRPEDAILYTNYFGLNANNVEELTKHYSNVIIDNAQAFFDKPLANVSTFYSPRKFFGLPDGGLVYGANEISANNYFKDKSSGRMMHLLTRIEEGAEAGYLMFRENDAKLNSQPIKLMSNLTHTLLAGIDYDDVKNRRILNFKLMHQSLKKTNKLTEWIDKANVSGPIVYPYWISNGSDLRKQLLKHKIYTAMYWPNVLEWVGSNTIEFELSKNVVCIPIDQRISNSDLSKIIHLVNG